MATVINAGRVAMVPKGEWDASTAYVRLDVVLYNGSSWVAIADSTGQVPAEGSTYWQILSLKGEQGEKGDKGDTGATGATGTKGDKGDTGATGPQGPKGDKGDKGEQGEDGKSAYQSYLDTTSDNPPKTESEWVTSLKGADGHDGVSLGEVAIVNNLTEGGSDKVLSAEMGKELADIVYPNRNIMVNTQLTPQINGYIDVSSGLWKTSSAYKGRVIDVREYNYDIIKIGNIRNDSDTGWFYRFALLKSFSSVVQNQRPDYCDGYEGLQNYTDASAPQWVILPKPDNCNYIYVYGPNYGANTPELWLIVNNPLDLSEIVANLTAEVKQITNDVTETITINDVTLNDLCIVNGLWAYVGSGYFSALIPLVQDYEYRLNFDKIGGYCIVYDSEPISGQEVSFVPPYNNQINTASGDEIIINGVSGQYLYLRADTATGGRAFPTITVVTSRKLAFTKEDIDDEPVENSNNIVSSGGIYRSLKNIKKEISILFIGNSLMQDAISYLPYIIKQLNPNVIYKFYIWYNGGYTLAQQYTKFINNQTCEIYSVCNDGSARWLNYNNSMTMTQILSGINFDILCVQEYFNYKNTFDENDLTDFNNVVNFVRNNYTGIFKVVSFLHAPLRSSADTVFSRTILGNKLILSKTIAENIIPAGIAVYDALSTDLDNLGDRGHLSPDGTHTQEGLPCLMQSFVVYQWLMRELGLSTTITNSQLKMTNEIYNSINVPGPNLGTGVIEGTDSENILAKDIAINAYKKGLGLVISSLVDMNDF